MSDIAQVWGVTTITACQGGFSLTKPAAFYRGYIRGLVEAITGLERDRFQHSAELIKEVTYSMILRAGIALNHLLDNSQCFTGVSPAHTSSDKYRNLGAAFDRGSEGPKSDVIFRYYEVYSRRTATGNVVGLEQMRRQFSFNKPDAFYEGYIKALIQVVLFFEDQNFVFTSKQLMALHAGFVTRVVFLTNRYPE